MSPGKFITFEGIEGSGKSTQLILVADYLTSKGYTVIQTKEPGGTDFGMTIRNILLDPKTKFKDPYTELLLFTADRLEHIRNIIQPALDQGHIVLCDRYIDSTIAYQIGGRQLPKNMVMKLIDMIPLKPSLTLLLDTPIEVGLQRAKNRAELDRFEQEDVDFHSRVRNAYLQTAKEHPSRIRIIDGNTKSIKTIAAEMKQFIDNLLD